MKNKIIKLRNSSFLRSVLTVASGTAASQAITLAFSPLITRIYGPEAFGLQGVFNSVLNVLVVIAALGYPAAIVLPRRDSDAVKLAWLSLIIAAITCSIAAIAFSFVDSKLLIILNIENIFGLIHFLPIAMFVSILINVLAQWLIRQKAYGIGARYAVIGALLSNVVKSVMGLSYPMAAMLIASNIFGGLLGAILTWFGWRMHLRESKKEAGQPAEFQRHSMSQLANQYRDFPLLRTPQNLINAISQSLPILMLSAFFGAAQAGQYAIALAALALPAGLIGGSVMSVFYPRINEAINNGENSSKLIVDATLGMAATGALPYLVVAIAGPFLFEFVFGGDWRTAGVYAQLLAAWLFLQYVNKPAVSAIPALRLQGGLLFYELFSTFGKVLALWLGFKLFQSDFIAVGLFSLFGTISYILLILWVVRSSSKERGE